MLSSALAPNRVAMTPSPAGGPAASRTWLKNVCPGVASHAQPPTINDAVGGP